MFPPSYSRILICKSIKYYVTLSSSYSIKAYIAATKAKTVLQPLHLDVSEPWEKWSGLASSSCDAIIAINLLQYSSFKTAEVGSLLLDHL